MAEINKEDVGRVVRRCIKKRETHPNREDIEVIYVTKLKKAITPLINYYSIFAERGQQVKKEIRELTIKELEKKGWYEGGAWEFGRREFVYKQRENPN